jgi:hypothetical protein
MISISIGSNQNFKNTIVFFKNTISQNSSFNNTIAFIKTKTKPSSHKTSESKLGTTPESSKNQ